MEHPVLQVDDVLSAATAASDVRELHRIVRELEASEDACVELALRVKRDDDERDAISMALCAFAQGYCGKCSGELPEPPGWPIATAPAAYLAARCWLLISDAHRIRGDWSAAEAALAQAREVECRTLLPDAPRPGNLAELRAQVAVCEASLLTAQSRWSEAIALIDRAFDVFRAERDEVGQCHALLARGHTWLDNGNFPHALRDLMTALALAPTPRMKAGLQVEQAHLSHHMGDDVSAEALLVDARRTYEMLADNVGLAKVARHNGQIRFREARDLREESAEAEERLADLRATPDHDNMLELQVAREAHEKSVRGESASDAALISLQEALQRAEQARNMPEMARAHYSMAKVHLFQLDLKMALDNCNLASKAFVALRDTRHAAMCEVLRGMILAARRSDPDGRTQAEKLFQAGLDGLRAAADRQHLASALFDVCRVRHRWADMGGAADALEEALEVAPKMHAEVIIDRCRKLQAQLEVSPQRWVSALAKLSRSERHLAAEHDAIGMFLAMVYHDLTNELGPVVGSLPGLLDSWDGFSDAERREFVRNACIAGRYIQDLLTAILNDTKIAAGALQVAMQPTLLHPIAVNAIELMRQRLQVNSVRDVDKRCAFENAVGTDVLVLGEARLLERVLVNILGNATKFTQKYLESAPDDRGSIAVAAERKGAKVLVTVTDTGTGILAQDIDGVFDMFGQGRAMSGRSHGERTMRGFGIGLAFCAATVTAHGGQIEVDRQYTRHVTESPEHHGTCIRLTLNAAE